MKEEIQLSDCPVDLQQAVNKYLSRSTEIEVLAVQKLLQTPYKDKTITDTTYRVFTRQANYFCVYKTSVCSNQEWNNHRDVDQRCMIAGEIAEIVALSPEWFLK